MIKKAAATLNTVNKNPSQKALVPARTNNLTETYVRDLTSDKYKIPCFEIRRKKLDDRNQNGVRVATMHRVKGLEFQYVFVVYYFQLFWYQ